MYCVDGFRPAGLAIAAHVGRDGVIAGVGERLELMAPRIPGFRKAVAKENERARSRLGEMHARCRSPRSCDGRSQSRVPPTADIHLYAFDDGSAMRGRPPRATLLRGEPLVPFGPERGFEGAAGYDARQINCAAPAPIIKAPSAFARSSPFGASFSIATSRVSAAIHKRSIAPPTNSKAMSAQQQPRQ